MPIKTSNTPKIIFHSGLGNQIFQWFFFKHLTLSGISVEPGYVSTLLSESRKLQVRSLLEADGFTIKEISSRSFYISSLMSRINRCHDFFSHPILDYRAFPFSTPEQERVLRSKMLLGYFQDISLVEKEATRVLPTLESYLQSIELVVNLAPYKDYNLVHVRRGDLQTTANSKKYGILSRDYYMRLEINNNYPTLVTTDDLEYANYISEKMNVARVYGPREINAWQTLKLMSKARNLYCANSTLSLWASFLVLALGGSVYCPYPFFRDAEMESAAAFRPKGAYLLPSSFSD